MGCILTGLSLNEPEDFLYKTLPFLIQLKIFK